MDLDGMQDAHEKAIWKKGYAAGVLARPKSEERQEFIDKAAIALAAGMLASQNYYCQTEVSSSAYTYAVALWKERERRKD